MVLDGYDFFRPLYVGHERLSVQGLYHVHAQHCGAYALRPERVRRLYGVRKGCAAADDQHVRAVVPFHEAAAHHRIPPAAYTAVHGAVGLIGLKHHLFGVLRVVGRQHRKPGHRAHYAHVLEELVGHAFPFAGAHARVGAEKLDVKVRIRHEGAHLLHGAHGEKARVGAHERLHAGGSQPRRDHYRAALGDAALDYPVRVLLLQPRGAEHGHGVGGDHDYLVVLFDKLGQRLHEGRAGG